MRRLAGACFLFLAVWGVATAVSFASESSDHVVNVADHGVAATRAGDCRRGQSLVVRAINEGREAAREIDRALMGTTLLP